MSAGAQRRRRTRGTIVVAGSVAQKPRYGGHTWVYLQYVLGLRRLGWDSIFVDRLDPSMLVDEEGRAVPAERSPQVRYFLEVVTRFGLADSFCLLAGGRTFGLARETLRARLSESAFLLNVMGFLDDEELLAAAPRRVFLDIDPGFGQMWRELGLADIFAGHDDHVTIGENIGSRASSIPTCGLDWLTTPQPVVLEHWPPAPPPPASAPFTSVASWRGAFAPVEYGGRVYGLRVHEFRRFADLPRLTGRRFELALAIDPADFADRDALLAGEWRLLDPQATAGDPWSYRSFIEGSLAEFMVAKNVYVDTASGWFSDRSICYLATGRPVLARDTGLAGLYPVGEGLLTFATPEEAHEGVERIAADYARHARAARQLAEERFDSDRVLGRLLAALGV